MNPIEFELNNAKLKVFSSGDIWKFELKNWRSKEETWHQSKGTISTNKSGYSRHRTKINNKIYTTSRVIYKAFNMDWNINDASPDNTIDHIDRNSLNNDITNLRVADMIVQNINRDCVINAKGCYLRKNGRWVAEIRRTKRIYLGSFDTEDEARQAYLFAVANR
jgi:AP2 domain